MTGAQPFSIGNHISIFWLGMFPMQPVMFFTVLSVTVQLQIFVPAYFCANTIFAIGELAIYVNAQCLRI